MARSGLCVPASIAPRVAGLGLDHAVALGAERGAQEAPDLGLVLDHQDGGARLGHSGGTCRRVLERQREAERGAAAGPPLRPDAPAVQLDDRAADGEAEADAADRASGAPRWNLPNSALLVARRQARARRPPPRRAARRRTRTARRRAPACPAACTCAAFSSRLTSTCSISAGVDAHQRQVAREVDRDRVLREALAQARAAPRRRSRRANASRVRARCRRASRRVISSTLATSWLISCDCS